MGFLRSLIQIVSTIFLSFKPFKHRDRVNSTLDKSGKRFGAKSPLKASSLIAEVNEIDQTKPHNATFSGLSTREGISPKSSEAVQNTDIFKEVIVGVPDIYPEGTQHKDQLPVCSHEEIVPVPQIESDIPTSRTKSVYKEIENDNKSSAQTDTSTSIDGNNPISESHLAREAFYEPVEDSGENLVPNLSTLGDTQPMVSPNHKAIDLQEQNFTPKTEEDQCKRHPVDQPVKDTNMILHDAIGEEELDNNEKIGQDNEYDDETKAGIWVEDDEAQLDPLPEDVDEEIPSKKKTKDIYPLIKSHRSTYYGKFLAQRLSAPILSEEDINGFLSDLYADRLEAILNWPLSKLENYLFNALKRNELIGELPIPNEVFIQLTQYIRRAAANKKIIDQKSIPPALYLISMVFCARYSESDARNFWEPYASLVWGLDQASLSFQQKCRKHFVNCREDLHQVLHLNFNYHIEGEVVRPVYQHAIIPSYLQGPLAEWLVSNFETILQYSANQLPLILQNEKSLDYMPRRLREFIRSEETKETAARLITRMSNAVKLFHEAEQSEAVESVMNSSIEKSLWEVIYKKLINDQSHLVKLRRITPRLEWLWDLEDDEIILNLSNIRSIRSEKPDSVTWPEKDAVYLKGNDIFIKVHPWKMKSGNWEIDPVRIPAKGPLDGSILVLSEDFDLDEDKSSQSSHIIFERTVPPLQKPVIFFRVNPRRNIAVQKEQIDSDGSWIIASNEKFQITDKAGNQVRVHSKNMPYLLRESGFIHAGIYSIQLPVTIHLCEKTILLEGTEDQQEINPSLRGTEKVSGLSTDIPPVFRSPDVDFQFSINTNSQYLQRTWLSLRRNGEFMQSILLADLVNLGKMRMDENLCVINLSSFLIQSGAYSINLLHDMRSLLEEPVQFAWLPEDVEIIGPRPDVCYSPLNPLHVTIRGVSEEQVVLIHDEKSKITTDGNAVKIEWKMLRNSQCRFDLLWEGSLIHFCWNIDRVSAWIEGGGDKNRVAEDQEQDVVLQTRGQPNEIFSWFIEGEQRNTQLNAKGEFQAKLVETEVRDMLLEDDQAKSIVLIAIRGYTWELFENYKKPVIEMTKVSYHKPVIGVTLTQIRKLHGTYTVQVRNTTDQSKPEVLSVVDVLEEDLTFQVILNPGEYQIEILLYDTLIQTSPKFRVEEEPVKTGKVSIEVAPVYGSPEHLFRILTATKQELLSRSFDRLPITPAIEQLQLIHTPEEWLSNKRWNDGLKRLLPSWAVLMYPLQFTTKNHRRILHAFPERALYGGRAGRGYIELKLDEERIRIAASWRPRKDSEFSVLWMGISQEQNIRHFSEIDQDDLWPAYQCKDCGTIVASRNGTYLKLAPSVVRLHQHGEERNLYEQFIDTVYDKQNIVEISLAQYIEKPLLHAYRAKDVVFNNYMQLLIDGKTRPIHRDLEQPINLYSNSDFGLAVSDLYEHLLHPAVQKILGFSNEFDRLDSYMEDEKYDVPAFGAMQRLMQYMYESTSPLNIPGDVLSLAMTLRLKANLPQVYNNLLTSLQIPEGSLIECVEYIAQGCPKMLEWSIAWTELFYVHAIS